jgi:protein-S-isoprenylcysteine O-methyltransferase Ste14
MLRIVSFVELLLCWAAWSLAFVKPRRQAKGQKKAVRAPASRWGILLVMLGFACTWLYVRPAGFEKPAYFLIAAMILAPFAAMLAWAATRHLGKQWRYEAALSEDHELIKTGPYRWIRHPIYTSMFGMLLATLLAWTWRPLWIAAIAFFIVGTEIRIRAEERLLAERFQGEFAAYRAGTWAYIPFIR